MSNQKPTKHRFQFKLNNYSNTLKKLMTNTNFEAFPNSSAEYSAQSRQLWKVNWKEKWSWWTFILKFGTWIAFPEFVFFCCACSCLKRLLVRIIRDFLVKRYLQLFFLLLPTLWTWHPIAVESGPNASILFSGSFNLQAPSWALKKKKKTKPRSSVLLIRR